MHNVNRGWATISSARTTKYGTAGHIAVWPVITGQSLIYGFYMLPVIDQMQIHRIVGTDGIVGCNCICNFTMSFDGFSFKDVAGCFNKKRDRAVYYWD